MVTYVNGEGSISAKLLIVGTAPGSQELIEGRPFVGFSGKLLMQALQRANLSRGECYITNVLKVKPPHDDMSPYYYDSKGTQPKPELEKAISDLRDEILKVKPNAVLVLGRHALFALTNRTEITKLRGSLLESTLIPGLKVIASIHPAMVLRVWKWKSMLFSDVAKAKKESDTDKFTKPNRAFIIQPTFNQVEEFLNVAMSKELICLDIETYRDVKRSIKCIGIGYDTVNAISIPISTYKGYYWTARNEAKIWQCIDKAINTVPLVVGHNLFFDLLVLGELYGVSKKGINGFNTFDTMLAFHSIFLEMPKSLEFLCSIYSSEPYYKDEGAKASAKFNDITLWQYNCKDVVVTTEIMEILQRELDEENCRQTFNFQMGSLEPALFLAAKGLRVDIEEKNRATKILEAQIEAEYEALTKAVGKPLNVNSSQQVIQLLKELGYKVKTTRKSELEDLAVKYDIPVLNAIVSLREKIKIKSAYYGANLYNGRLKFSVNLTGTKTGRWSTSTHPFGVGGNIHSFPKVSYRKAIIPDVGCVFISGDYEQAEARVVAYLSNDISLIEAFESGKSVFHELASVIFNVPSEDVSTDQRFKAKKLTHASNYNIGYKRFAIIAKVSEERSKELLDIYYNKTNIRYYHKWVQLELSKSMTLTTPYFNRKRVFYDRWGDRLFREAYAQIPQSLVADINTLFLQRVYRELGDKVDIAMSVHDQVVVQVKTELVNEILPKIKELSKVPIEINGRVLIIPSKIKIGNSWEEVS